MTRINLVDVSELTDQHLMAEYRELPRIFGLAEKHQNSGKKMPVTDGYKLGTGHVVFFYDKIQFLIDRQKAIIAELLDRNFKISHTEVQVPVLDNKYMNNWSANDNDIMLSKSRLREKLLQRPDFYKFKSKPVEINFYD